MGYPWNNFGKTFLKSRSISKSTSNIIDPLLGLTSAGGSIPMTYECTSFRLLNTYGCPYFLFMFPMISSVLRVGWIRWWISSVSFWRHPCGLPGKVGQSRRLVTRHSRGRSRRDHAPRTFCWVLPGVTATSWDLT